MVDRQAAADWRPDYELLLRGGTVVDGTGGPPRRADVLIRDGRIASMERHRPGFPLPQHTIDVGGLVVAPGFIDMHSHSDLAVLADPEHIAKVAQGVTTEVLGQDGLSYAPVTDATLGQLREQLRGWNGDPELDYDWRSVGEYLDRIDRGAAVNAAYLVPHGTVRLAVMGTDERAATAEELARMRALVEEGLAQGAAGLSTGLTYTPGMYADDEEIVELCAAVRAHGGYYCPHHRNYGAEVVRGYLDCLEIARRAQVPLHLAHCHVNFPPNAGRAHEVLDAIDRASAEHGLDVTLDTYPYLAGATYLAALLPSRVQAGGTAATLARLRDPARRAEIAHEIEVSGSDGHHGMPMDWSTIVISGTGEEQAWAVGRSIAELAAERGAAPAELFFDLLLADELATGCLVQVGNEDNVRAIMTHRAHTGGSDGILVGARPHPRGWGTFPRYLGHYVRELGLLSLEEAVAHFTSRPARRLGLADRGVLRRGAVADLVVFDPDRVADTATYENPKRRPAGIEHVFVNGVKTLAYGRRTGLLPGRALRRRTDPRG
ncbi:N-acyl-D-amino-acid deacylase family protein [Allonocardiopsis opalescens]|uniref:Dihydroorotase n=1 Tax=Allonocardiopsis opalescens TaxID=1144618 RepID=A0A2T0QAH9_9ACTN|nr:D-aminoacylase [Allonocardiopsis opalescens]PRY00812.1 dihydroorotase [Allonocardiopsis opalescens]